MRVKGRITSWNDQKGFGFITPLDGRNRVFVHINAFSNRGRRPEINQIVTYGLSTDKQGRVCAANATLAGDRLVKDKTRSKGGLALIGAACFLILLGVSAYTANLPPYVFAIYVVASLLTFIVYAVDKSAAKNQTRRTPESTLHLLSLVGGWPGALVAQQKLRHKSKKQPFRAVFWATVLLNCGLLVWILTPTGSATMRSLIASVS